MSNKRPYNYIELWKRKEIIECSLTKKESIKKCAQRLGVKYITAKHIVKVYKRTGRIETKIMTKNRHADYLLGDAYNKYCFDPTHYTLEEQAAMPPYTASMFGSQNRGLDMSYMQYYDPSYCTVILPNTPEMDVSKMSPGEMLQKGIVLMPDQAAPANPLHRP